MGVDLCTMKNKLQGEYCASQYQYTSQWFPCTSNVLGKDAVSQQSGV